MAISTDPTATAEHAPGPPKLIQSYAYTAWHPERQESVEGHVEASGATEARRALEADGLVVTEIALVRKSRFATELRRFSDDNRPLKARELAWLSGRLSRLERANIPTETQLAILLRERQSKRGDRIAPIIASVLEAVQGGILPRQAWAVHKDQLGELFCTMMEAGEVSGSMADSLQRLAAGTRKNFETIRKVRKTFYYPAAVCVFAIGLLAAALLFIVPTFKHLYATLGGKLPLPTRITVAVSSAILGRFYIVIPLLVLAFFGVRRAWRWPKVKEMRQWSSLSLPVIKVIVYKSVIVRICDTLSSLLRAHVPTERALEVTARASTNSVFSDALMQARELQVASGAQLSTALRRAKVFDEELIASVVVGEKDGEVAAALENQRDLAAGDLDEALEGLQSALEPFLIMILGAFAGTLIITLYLPLFDYIKLINPSG